MDIPDPKTADTLMSYVLDHYIKHYDAVLKKLDHAKSATRQSAKDLKKNKVDGKLAEVQAYEGMWKKVIDMFQSSGMSEEELVRIEGILTGMPDVIRKYYEVLIKQDEVLQALLRELETEEYKKAMAVTREVQSKPDLMSGLSASEFEPELPKHHSAFIFKVPPRDGSVH